jgi:hypothetical protein
VKGEAWCADMVHWVQMTAGVSQWPRMPSCETIEQFARQHGILHDAPQRGDVFLLCDEIGPFHTGFVTRATGGYVETIEGNTGSASVADGDGVYRKRRSIAACEFVRWADLPGVRPAAPARPAARVQLVDGAGGRRAIDCRPVLEAGHLRGDVRALAEAMGQEIVFMGDAFGLIPKGAPWPGALSLKLTPGNSDGHPAIEGDKLRAEIRYIAESLGYKVDTSDFVAAGIVRLHR